LTQTLNAARESGASLVILDTPGKNGNIATEAARRADLVLVMTRPHTFDMETLPSVRDILRIAGDPPAFVLYNNLHPAGNRQADQFKGVTLEFCGIEPCPVHLSQRASYGEATAEGKAAPEIEPDGKAAAELEALYNFAKEIMTHGNRNTEKPATRA
jgi:chromosome partitioning protein